MGYKPYCDKNPDTMSGFFHYICFMLLGSLGNTVIFNDFGKLERGWIIYIDHQNITIKTHNGSVYFNAAIVYPITRIVLMEKYIV